MAQAHTALATLCGLPSRNSRSLYCSNPSNNFGAFIPRVAHAHTELAAFCGLPSRNSRSLYWSSPWNNFGASAPRVAQAHTELATACGFPSRSNRSLYWSNPSNNFGAFTPRVAQAHTALAISCEFPFCKYQSALRSKFAISLGTGALAFAAAWTESAIFWQSRSSNNLSFTWSNSAKNAVMWCRLCFGILIFAKAFAVFPILLALKCLTCCGRSPTSSKNNASCVSTWRIRANWLMIVE